jgi:hypothetical protein
MTALGPGEIAASRRPLLLLSVTGLRLLAGLCLAWPLSALVAQTGVGLRAEGDRALFEGGGYLLLEVLRLRGGELAAVARGLLPVLALGLVLTAACNAVLLVGLNLQGRLRLRELLSRASERLPRLVALGGGTALGQFLLFVAGAVAVSAIPEALARPVATTAAEVLLWLFVALAAGALGGFSDLVKASLIRHEAPLLEALAHAFKCLRHRPILGGFGWVPYAAAFVAVAVLVGKLTEIIDVARPGAWRVACVFAIHQLVVLSSVTARAIWYARALRLVATNP